MKNELIGGTIGTGLGIVGTATQTNETLQTISLVVTIVGAVISFILVPLLNFLRNAKEDGKIDRKEAEQAIRIITDGAKDVADAVKKGEKEDGEIHDDVL